MKNVFLLIILVTFSTACFSSNTELILKINQKLAKYTNPDNIWNGNGMDYKAAYRLDNGLLIKNKISNKIKLGTGIIESRKGFKIENYLILNDEGIAYRSGTANVIYKFIEVPLSLDYVLETPKRLKPYFSVGFSNQFIFKYKFLTIPERDIILSRGELHEQGLRRYNIGLIGQIGFFKDVSDKLDVGFDIGGNYSLLKISRHKDASNIHLYTFDLGLNIIYKL